MFHNVKNKLHKQKQQKDVRKAGKVKATHGSHGSGSSAERSGERDNQNTGPLPGVSGHSSGTPHNNTTSPTAAA